jgi:hypothetical protein
MKRESFRYKIPSAPHLEGECWLAPSKKPQAPDLSIGTELICQNLWRDRNRLVIPKYNLTLSGTLKWRDYFPFKNTCIPSNLNAASCD